jgi:Protein of unknown function (DUF3025)
MQGQPQGQPNWQQAEAALATPFFDAIRELLLALRQREMAAWPSHDALNALAGARDLRLQCHLPARIEAYPHTLRFVELADGGLSAMLYETRIIGTGEIPTRNNWHDLFNALQWLTFPQMKSAISMMHAHLLNTGGAEEARARSTPRDVLTMFDESGVIVASANSTLLQLIREFRWHDLFVVRREDVMRDMRIVLVGHGLMEKALTPFIGMTGKAMLLNVDERADLDIEAAHWLSNTAHLQSSRQLAPLPLLGIPGWDVRNEDAAFYDNTDYFRPGYTRDKKSA